MNYSRMLHQIYQEFYFETTFKAAVNAVLLLAHDLYIGDFFFLNTGDKSNFLTKKQEK